MNSFRLILVLMGALSSAHASALTAYLGRYNIGVDYVHSADGMNLTYETDTPGGGPVKGCEQTLSSAARMRCATPLAAGGSSGFGVFLQQPFQRQGQFYFNWDLGFGVRALSGSLRETEAAKLADRNLPLKRVEFALVGLLARPYVQLGITPSSWPDLLLSFGPMIQVAAGRVRLNEEREAVLVGTTSGITGFMELEVVLKRFGEGAFSLISSRDFSGDARGSLFFPRSVDGMDDFRVQFSRHVGGAAFGFGLKLLLDFP